jgi:hypothetical protein
VFLKRIYALFFIELAPRKVHLPGVTAHTSGIWVVQLPVNLLIGLDQRADALRFLLRDRDANVTAAGIDVLRTPPQTPQAKRVRRALGRHVAA